MTTTNYIVTNGDGTSCHSGLSGQAARDLAQQRANERREPYFVTAAGGGDGERFDPEPVAAATESQLMTIRARAYNDTAREMARAGVRLTHDQIDEADAVNLGDADQRRASSGAVAWLSERLGLRVRQTDTGVECTPV